MRDRRQPTPNRRLVLWGCAAAALTSGLLLPASPAEAQVLQLMRTIADGGSWINLPVRKGKASLSSPAIPLAGLALNGCLLVWRGHSGKWTVRARDTLGDKELDVVALPGQPVKFDYKAGFKAQLDLEVEWTEPRDTTLFMWVGLSPGRKKEEEGDGKNPDDRDICRPPAR
ncbi:MAG: hypothetical protein OXQ94_07430 [Gemmatimonadota bacterium]|nr:hypothetical protein [Gemmatimonadota bacterium]MDE2871507.1 hypothetical protein [Gemmatimonadota bacterium]